MYWKIFMQKSKLGFNFFIYCVVLYSCEEIPRHRNYPLKSEISFIKNFVYPGFEGALRKIAKSTIRFVT
jgi:hypothetical protein